MCTAIITLLLLGFATGTGRSKAGAPESKTASRDKKAAARADFTVTEVQLAKEFTDDQSAVRRSTRTRSSKSTAWCGWCRPVFYRTLVLKGTFETSVGELGQRVKGTQIVCRVGWASRGKVMSLSETQKVKVRVRFLHADEYAIHCGDSEVTEAGPDPSIAVKAVDLSKAYATNVAAADKKYKDKPLVVEGMVVDVQLRDGNPADILNGKRQPIVFLEGFDEKAESPLRVEVHFPAARGKIGLAKRDKIKVKGQCAGMQDGAVTIWRARLVK